MDCALQLYLALASTTLAIFIVHRGWCCVLPVNAVVSGSVSGVVAYLT